VAPLPIDIGVDRTANESQIKSQPISRKADGEADAPSIRTDSEATKASPEKPMVSGSAAGDPMDPHSSNVSQVLHGSGITSMSPNGDSAVTPPPSPESKHIPPASTIDCDQAVDGYSDVNTPPLSRKASRPELIHENVNSTPEACEEEHDPAVTNPFIVQAPYVKPPVHIDYGTNLHIGNGTFINRNFVVIDSPVCSIRIGERCLLGPSVILAAVEHPLGMLESSSVLHMDLRNSYWPCMRGFFASKVITLPSIKSQANVPETSDADERISPCGAPSFASSIEIGDECWIAAGVMVLCGVKIGSGCVIGAGSVVTKVSTI
jgi:acetyltransferase-like isoleucine patch superfamily enzyme